MKSVKQLLLISLKKLTILSLVLSIGFIHSIEFKIDVQATNITSNPFESLDRAREARIQNVQSTQNEPSSVNTFKTNSVTSLDSNQYFVKFKETVSFDVISRVLTPYVYNMLGSSKHRTFAISTNDYLGLETALSGLVDYIEKESDIKIEADTNDTYYTNQWGLTAANIPPVWDYTTGSNDVSVCIIDTGFSNTHPDLKSNMFRQGWDYANGGEVLDDPDGHGTMVAGIIAADSNNYKGIAGINRNTFIIPLKIPLIGEYFDTSKIIEALYDAGDSGCDVINMSLGGPTFSPTFNNAVQYAYSQGSIIIASAGNDATKGNPINYPASYNNVISVGSINSSLNRSSFSNYNNYVDVVAPGENILTTNNNDWYEYVSGTSFSAPHVAGIAALIKSVKPDLTTNNFMDLIKTTSRDLGTTGYDNQYGYGLINATSMLDQLFKPSPISNLTVKYSNQSDSVELNWTASQKANYYDVYRSVGTQSNFVKIVTGITTNSYLDKTYISNSDIYYKVVGYSVVNGKNMFGQYSNIMLISTPPLPPIITLNEFNQTIYWNSVVGSEGYIVYQNGTEIADLSSTTLSYKLPSLESGFQYDFQVSSKKGSIAGKKSNTVTISPMYVAPTNFIITDTDFDGFSFSWNTLDDSSNFQYEILASTTLNGVYTSVLKTSSSNPKLTGLTFNKEYYFKVRVIDNNGNIGLMSNAVNGKTGLKNVSGLYLHDIIFSSTTLRWDTVPGASGYEVYYSNGSTTFTLAKTVTTNEFSQYNLPTNTLIKYKVRAYRMVGTTKVYSDYSDVLDVKTLLEFTEVKYEPVDSHSFKLKWYKVPYATEYAIYVFDLSVSGFYREVARTFNNEIYLYTDDYSFYEQYHVKVLSVDNQSNLSNGVVGGLTPTTISKINLEPNFNSVKLTWNESVGANKYDVYMGTSLTAINQKIGTVTSNSFETGQILNYNQTYFFTVVPIAPNGLSNNSSPKVAIKTALKKVVDLSVSSPNASSADLSWSAVEGAAGYEVYFSKGLNSNTYTLLRSVTTLNTNHTGLSVNTIFNYRVRAYRMAGTVKVFSDYSDVKSITTPPSTPVLKAVSKSIDTISLSWTKVVNATGYVVYVNGVENSVINDGNTISVDISGLNLGESYDFSLVAKNGDLSSAPSSIVKATPIPSSVTNFKVSDVNFNRLSLSWESVEGAERYDVYQGTSSTAVTTKVGSVTETSFSTTTPLNYNTIYYYKVIPVTANGVSGTASPVINGKTALKPVRDLSVSSPNASSADLSWSAVEGAAGYEVYFSRGLNSSTYTLLRSVTTLNTNHTGLSVNTIFNYRVRAYRMAGTVKVFSDYSDVKSVTINHRINLEFESINSDEFKLKWNQIPGATEYVIYQFSEDNEENSVEIARSTGLEVVISVNSMDDKFYYFVKTISTNINDIVSNTVQAGGIPNPVENVIVSPQYDRAHLSWDLNDDAASYDIYMSTNPTVLGNKLGNTVINEYNTGSILNYGHYYYFRIVPVSKIGLTINLNKLPKMYIVQANLPKIESLNIESTKDNKTIFTWNSIENADGYEIYYKIDNYMNYNLLTSIEANSNYSTILSQDTDYIFKIRSFKQIGSSKIYSAFSDETNFLTPLYTPSLHVANNIAGEIVLDWVTNDIASHFEIYVNNVLYKTVVNSKAITMKETINDLTIGTNYEFKLVAINQTNRSLASEVVIAMIHPKKVENLEVTSTTYNSITLNWSASEGAQKYRILYGLEGILSQSIYVENQEFATVSNLLVNKTYEFIVVPQTIDGKGNSWSVKVNGTTKLDPVKNLTISTVFENKIELRWDPVQGAQSYVITEFINGNQTSKFYYSNTTSKEITGITSYKTYSYKIQPYIIQNGVNEFGPEVMSNDYVYVNALVNISESYKVLDIGESFKLDAYVYPEDASYKNVRFASSDPTIATVDENGLINAISPGLARITAISAEDYKVCEVAVQLSFSGTGNQSIDNLSVLNKGQYNNNYKVIATHTGSGSFVLNSYQNTEMKLKTVFDEIGNYEGENLLYDGYTKDFLDVDLEIITEGEWTVKIVPMAGSSTSTMNGTGDTVTRWVKDILGTSNVTFSYNGTDEFSLWKVTRNSSKTLINSGTGPTTTSFSVYVPQVDPYEIAFVIQGSGDWSIDFNLGAEITQY